MVTTTATIPITIPSVVRMPRALLALMAWSAIWNDSRSASRLLMLTLRPFGPLPFRLLGVVHVHDGTVVEVLRDRAVAPGDDLVPFLEPVGHLDQVLALDPGLHLLGYGLPVLDAEDDLDEAVLVRLVLPFGVLPLLA